MHSYIKEILETSLEYKRKELKNAELELDWAEKNVERNQQTLERLENEVAILEQALSNGL